MDTKTATDKPSGSTPHSLSSPRAVQRTRVGILGGESSGFHAVKRLFASRDFQCDHLDLAPENDFGQLQGFDVVVLVDHSSSSASVRNVPSARQQAQLALLRKRRMGSLILTDRAWMFAGFDAGVVCLPPDAPFERVRGALAALSHMRPLIRQVDKQLVAMQRLGKSLQRRFADTDRELQLAARLQRDFLPHELPQAGPFRFHALFRPCSWVSGDIFDVFQLDEKHWGFYLADAVGHGVAAGLLTMYIKHAIRPKRVHRDGYELVAPSQVLSHLNDLLTAQGLADSQFITGFYGLLNIETRVLRYAIAGHPPALLLDAKGRIRELHGDGCLMGINAGETFSDESILLEPDHRVIVYSDGLENTLIAHRPPMPQMPAFEPGMPELLRRPADRLIAELRERLDTTPGSLAQADDVTVLFFDVSPN